MNRTIKIAVILFCFSLCSAATFVASGVREKCEPQKANAIPVKNHEIGRHIWIEI